MRQHRAFGAAGGTAGVLQREQIVETDVERGDRPSLRQLFGAELQRVRERLRGHGIFRNHLPQALYRLHDQSRHRREQLGDAVDQNRFDLTVRNDGRELVGEHVDDEEQLRARIVQREFRLGHRVQRIEVHDHAARFGGAEQEDRVSETIRALNRDAVAFLQAELEAQIRGEFVGHPIDLRVRERPGGSGRQARREGGRGRELAACLGDEVAQVFVSDRAEIRLATAHVVFEPRA